MPNDRNTPPPFPAQPIQSPNTPPPGQPYTDYDRTADTVGMVPNLRWKDNLYQFAGALGMACVGAFWAPWYFGRPQLQVAGAIGGFIVGILLGGVVLAFVGLARRRRPRQ